MYFISNFKLILFLGPWTSETHNMGIELKFLNSREFENRISMLVFGHTYTGVTVLPSGGAIMVRSQETFLRCLAMSTLTIVH